MGELLEVVQRWAWLASLLALGCWGAGAIRYWRKAAQLDLEAYKTRPLIPDDKVAVMRPGDTVLLMLPLKDMTLDQQTGMVDSTKRMAERAGVLGIEFIVIPDLGQKAVVVARSALSEHASGDGKNAPSPMDWDFPGRGLGRG